MCVYVCVCVCIYTTPGIPSQPAGAMPPGNPMNPRAGPTDGPGQQNAPLTSKPASAMLPGSPRSPRAFMPHTSEPGSTIDAFPDNRYGLTLLPPTVTEDMHQQHMAAMATTRRLQFQARVRADLEHAAAINADIKQRMQIAQTIRSLSMPRPSVRDADGQGPTPMTPERSVTVRQTLPQHL